MSQVGFTPIQLYRSSTAAAVPTAGNLVAGELAINTTDEKLYFENASGVVKLLASSAATGGTFTTVTATTVVNGLGLVGTPSYTFTGDLNTGMWSPAADTVAVSTGGTERMRLDTAGNLGINAVPVAGYGNSIQLKQVGGSATSALLHQSVGTNVQNLELLNNALPPAGGYTAGYNYTTTGEAATKYLSQAGNHIWFNAPTGTAGAAVTFSERMRITEAGNVGIGTTVPTEKLDVVGNAKISSGSSFYWGDATCQITAVNAGAMRFLTGTASEKMRIDSSGDVLMGKSVADFSATGVEYVATAKVFRSTTSDNPAVQLNRITSTGDILQFYYTATGVGSVSVTGSATAYNTSSDYRLKDIDGPIANSGTYIDALKPVQGSWKVDGGRFIGLLAHEVQEVSETPIATGEKDGKEMQAMDYSAPEIVANLIAEVQSLRARVAQLEGK